MLKITKLKHREPVYDLTIEDNHNMILNNGAIVHNCAEIVEFTSSDEIAVCNLSSIVLKNYICHITEITEKTKIIGFPHTELVLNLDMLWEYTYHAIKNLNKVIDVNFYPVPEAERSNLRHRPVGLGVQGLNDVFNLLKLPFESNDAHLLNKIIFETIYHASLTSSNDLAKKDGYYETYPNSPFSEGILQYDMWNKETLHKIKLISEYIYNKLYDNFYLVNENLYDFNKKLISDLITELNNNVNIPQLLDLNEDNIINLKLLLENLCVLSGIWNWTELKENIKLYGVRNSLLTAIMPTASTSQITDSVECIEPLTNNLYKRRTLSGEFPLYNPYLVQDLIDLNLWNDNIRNKILLKDGSIQDIVEIPQYIKDIYKNIWEIKQRKIILMAAGRGPFIDQTQSMNLFFDSPNNRKLEAAYTLSWLLGLKTGVYYLRSKPAADPIKITANNENLEENYENFVCNIDDPDCLACQ